jgi:RNA polymerase sigma factor (sigma-70 family)
MDGGATATPGTEDMVIEPFEAFFLRHQDQLLRAAFLLTGDAEEAKELSQETFVRVWERWDRVAAMEDPEGYVYRTAMNLWRSRLRRAAIAAGRMFRAPTRTDEIALVAERDAVFRALRALTPRQRAAVVLTELLDHTSEQAAAEMGIRPSTVRVLATQGRAAMREALGRSDG